MSICAIKDVIGMDLTPTEKLVLICLASHLDNGGYKQGKPSLVWPSYDELSRSSGLTSRGVKGVIGRLVEMGILAREKKGGGRKKCNVYRLELIRNSEPASPIPDLNSEPASPIQEEKGEAGAGKGEAGASIPINQDITRKEVGSEQSSSPPAMSISIPLKDGSEFEVSQKLIQEFVEAYPAVDVFQELQNIRQWNISNPKKQKTLGGIRRHITGWLKREQGRADEKDGFPDLMAGAI